MSSASKREQLAYLLDGADVISINVINTKVRTEHSGSESVTLVSGMPHDNMVIELIREALLSEQP